jgi:molybdenum cofactor cytidylyltransferase
MKIVAIVLAAGKSQRMGRNKLLLRIGKKTIIERILEALKKVKNTQIIVVLGHEKSKIESFLKNKVNNIKIIVNHEYEKGMISSFQAGIKAAKNNVDAAFLVLGDQLIFDPEILNEMVNKLSHENLIVSPKFKAKKGHPVLFSNKLFEEILNLKNEEVLRDLINRNKNHLVNINGRKWNIMDIDTPEDFKEIKKIKNNKFNNKK